MHTRPCRPGDFSAIATIGAKAFLDDNLYAWLCPKRKEYPEEWRRLFVRGTKQRYNAVGTYLFVAETDESDPEWNGQSQIAGYAAWERKGKSQSARRWRNNDSLLKKLERLLGQAEAAYTEAFRLDRCIDEKNVRAFRKLRDESFDKIPEYWNLLMLCVSPSFQRRGVGGRLLEWGFEKAVTEAVPLAVQSSPAGEGLYLGKGFKVISWVKITEDIVDPVMVWEPRDLESQSCQARRNRAEEEEACVTD
ncbi:MAG: hypothetical protein M1836_001854 [Candelina mexicana]|nr:MAG: hypothetical protein M1836_001854 [Candelina mexicana]